MRDYSGPRGASGMPHGVGKGTVSADGAVYEGSFVEGNLEGYGKISFPQGSDIAWCAGSFKDNKLTVRVVVYYPLFF